MNTEDKAFESTQRLKSIAPEMKDFFAAHGIVTCAQALEYVEKALSAHGATSTQPFDPPALELLRQELLQVLPPEVVSDVHSSAGAKWLKEFRPGVPLDIPCNRTQEKTNPLSDDGPRLERNSDGDLSLKNGETEGEEGQ